MSTWIFRLSFPKLYKKIVIFKNCREKGRKERRMEGKKKGREGERARKERREGLGILEIPGVESMALEK